MGNAIELRNVTKTFGTIIANDDVTLTIQEGEILSLLGENGSGKTTLMNMLSGIYFPDSGSIYVKGEQVEIRSPKDAYDLKIGMVHQHFKLIDVFTATENIALGNDKSIQGKFSLRSVKAKAREICDRYGFDLNLDQKVYEMSVSQKQTLEIVKVLYRGADYLILDEPTAVLTPQEVEKLFAVIRNMKADGKSVVIITHKLKEVLEISDRVAIMRKGRFIGSVLTAEATESSLTEMMVGEKIELNIARSVPANVRKRIEVRNLSVINHEGIKVLRDINFDINGGEILGIAGISGNGQKELLESIAGLQRTLGGTSIKYFPGEDEELELQLVGMNPRDIRNAGIHLAFVPEDRLGMGLVRSMGMDENMMLKTYDEGSSIITNRKLPREMAEQIKESLGVVTPSITTPVAQLSGGNVQKVLVGREIASDPTVIMTAYAVRGLDINTSYTIYRLLNEQKEQGTAVVYVGEELDVLLELCDRILVLCGGRVSGIVDARNSTKEELGLLMTNYGGKEEG